MTAVFGTLMRVQGESMRPVFRPGDVLWVCAPRRGWTPAVGDVVAARPAALNGRAIIKRVAGIADGQVSLIGEHPDSCDSRRFGAIAVSELIGPVAARVWPRRRSSP